MIGAATEPRRRFDAAEVQAHVTGDRFLALVQALGGSLAGARRSGVNLLVPCFLHGGTHRNLALRPDTGDWFCHSGCGGRGGRALDLVMVARSLSLPDAIEWLADWQGMSFDGSAPRTFAGASVTPAPKGAQPSPPKPVDERPGAFLASLWAIVEDAPLSPLVATMLERRGIDPDAAAGTGCLDMSTRWEEVGGLVDETPLDVLEAVGLARDGRVHPALVGILRADPSWASIAVPIWRFGCPYPERYRFRLVEPRPTRGGGVLKSFAPYATPDFPIDLLGAGRPPRLDAPEVSIAHLGSGTDGAGLVIIVEGEPDWWSATEAVDGRAVVLAVCGSPTKWRDGWPSLAELAALGVRRFAVCVHHGERGRDGLGHGERFADVVAAGCARAGLAFTRKLAAEGCDLNDLHKVGRLGDWLTDVLEVNDGV